MSETLPLHESAALWLPGNALDDEFPVPTDEELRDLWSMYSKAEAVCSTRDVYGVYTPPREVRAIASIDLCEVVRDTSKAFDYVVGREPERHTDYARGSWFIASQNTLAYERSVITDSLRVLMKNGFVQPVEGIRTIAAIMHNWRLQGIYCIANTSTLPGCEVGTIENTLQRYMPGCFDALVLPRNHDGNGSTTKAHALEILAREACLPLHDMPFVHIDDAPHHLVAFNNHYSSRRLALPPLFLQPMNGSNEAVPSATQTTSPLEAFVAANRYFNEAGVLV